MKIIEPSYEILDNINDHWGEDILRNIELAARVCYKSEDKMTKDSARTLVANLIKRGHESALEHEKISVRFICDRGMSHEIVRHRIASYSQESTRYCNYAKGDFGGELTFIKPFFFKDGSEEFEEWRLACLGAEQAYLKLIELGRSPQEARSVLPNSLKTEIVVTMNLREWRHFFFLRSARDAHPQMRELACPLLQDFRCFIPVVFDDVGETEL